MNGTFETRHHEGELEKAISNSCINQRLRMPGEESQSSPATAKTSIPASPFKLGRASRLRREEIERLAKQGDGRIVSSQHEPIVV